jgi:heptosyltransferase-2
MRIAVFLPNWIGDVVMATPALRALKNRVGQEGRVVGVMRPYVADVLAGTNWLDESILYQPKAAEPSHRWAVAREKLRCEQVDIAVLLTNSIRTAWMAWRSGARERIGYSRDLRGLFLTKRLKLARLSKGRFDPPPIDGYLRLASAAGCADESRQLELATTQADEAAADGVMNQLGIGANETTIVLNPGGGYGPSKWWPPEHFAALAHRLTNDFACNVIVNCGPKERDIARHITTLAACEKVFSLAEFDVPLGLSKAVIKRSQLLVTTDSGPRFFAVAFDRPVVSLFGPTSPEATPTHYARETTLSLSLDCQPCMERQCPLVHHNCMRELTVEKVYQASAEYLQRTHDS